MIAEKMNLGSKGKTVNVGVDVLRISWHRRNSL